jgi:ATP-dependent Lon protease
VLLPERNKKDVQADLPDSLKKELDIEHVSSIEALLEAVWGTGIWVGGRSKVEARL